MTFWIRAMKTFLQAVLLITAACCALHAETTEEKPAAEPAAKETAPPATEATQQEMLQEIRSIKRDMVILKAEMDAMNRRLSLVLSQQTLGGDSFESLMQTDPEQALEMLISLFEQKDFLRVFNMGMEFLRIAPEHEKGPIAYELAHAAFYRVNQGDYEKTMAWRKETGEQLWPLFRELVAAGHLDQKAVRMTLIGRNPTAVREITGAEDRHHFTLAPWKIEADYDNGRVETLEFTPIDDNADTPAPPSTDD